MIKDNTNNMEQNLTDSSDEQYTKTESIIKMLDKFESNNIISSEIKERYIDILNYCDFIESEYKKDKE